MSINLNENEISELKTAFQDLINYDADDPTEPIDPLKYRAPDGDTCLHVAASRGDIRSVQLLLKAGMDVNQAGDMGYTALHYAGKKGYEDIIQVLLSHGASKNIRDAFGKLPLNGDQKGAKWSPEKK